MINTTCEFSVQAHFSSYKTTVKQKLNSKKWDVQHLYIYIYINKLVFSAWNMRGVERGSARRPSLKGRERVIVNQTNIGIVSKATLEKLLRDGMERIWAFPSAYRYHLQLN